MPHLHIIILLASREKKLSGHNAEVSELADELD